MPFVHIRLVEGRTPEQKEKLANKIVAAMEETNIVSRESIHVIFEDMSKEDYHSGANMK